MGTSPRRKRSAQGPRRSTLPPPSASEGSAIAVAHSVSCVETDANVWIALGRGRQNTPVIPFLRPFHGPRARCRGFPREDASMLGSLITRAGVCVPCSSPACQEQACLPPRAAILSPAVRRVEARAACLNPRLPMRGCVVYAVAQRFLMVSYCMKATEQASRLCAGWAGTGSADVCAVGQASDRCWVS